MSSYATSTAAALRPRALSTQASPFALRTVGCWLPMADMRNTSAAAPAHLVHNSIAAPVAHSIATTGATPVNAGRNRYGAVKQAGPPRGVPR